MAATTGLMNPDVVLSVLDKVFFSEFNLMPAPQIATPTDSLIFNQSMADNSGVITEIMKDGGQWTERGEEEDYTQRAGVAGDKKTFYVAEFAQELPISRVFFKDDSYDTVKRLVLRFAQKGRTTDYTRAFGIFRNAFTTTLTNNGIALISDTQSNLNGDVIDNKLTAALSSSSLNDAVVKLAEQKDQSGDITGTQAKCLLVPPALFKEAVEITESVLEAGTSDNQMNVYSAKYGIVVKQSPFLGAAAGGSDTAWFLLGESHNIYRWEREAISTDLVDYKFDSKDNYKYKGRFRNVYGAVSYEGIVGSTGEA